MAAVNSGVEESARKARKRIRNVFIGKEEAKIRYSLLTPLSTRQCKTLSGNTIRTK